MESENELGAYLRARRAAVSPGDAGLPDGGSRRVPGLRRDEVALLAGVSTDYYIRLEQGRERHPSEQVLRAIAGALRLDDAAAAHLFRLGLSVFGTAAAATTVAPELLRLMDGMRDVPAFVIGAAQDVLAANAMARELYDGFARYDNLLRMIFLDPYAREFYADWDRAARIAVGNLRASASQFPYDERIERVVGGLSLRSPAFAGLWARYEVRPRTHEDKHFRHPRVGELRLHFEALAVTSAPGQHLSVYSAEPGSAGANSLVLLRRLSKQATSDSGDPDADSEDADEPVDQHDPDSTDGMHGTDGPETPTARSITSAEGDIRS
ncbi:helix-turn-helix transcriptional regulator [Streptomyces griseofuscus]|uniref:helix-turn-helix transcriptional regulator n=1 Tax=Streptomyces TaxID=1883 RepID=UPI00081F021A|nr:MULTISPECIES: helix-turn-helix transcriptional regulator [unclassified Streptomyces]MYQ93628.1 helix-turn-helix domain-containing protein [Streptomyces sp. SID4946]SCF83240.1 Helix-turn-helix domain-containing protein [Streptomyces sp. DconLS]SCF92705.1 Helix-turn-helix domain-containing protein [Streptomyces sp. LamerLS-31b]